MKRRLGFALFATATLTAVLGTAPIAANAITGPHPCNVNSNQHNSQFWGITNCFTFNAYFYVKYSGEFPVGQVCVKKGHILWEDNSALEIAPDIAYFAGRSYGTPVPC